ncbi:RNA-binding protein lark [Chionoecetes opilio]|uniref:RNA-binding protein lark n=1 Tax=Chionoecetes opilio TaxID=41210 RepID=A0A8J4YGH1_CHIOP|nr:RNA-binding protein lark [Chionoecetes opilio]
MNYAAYSGKGRKMPGGEVQKTFKIFCGNLAGAASKDDLYYLFSRYGPVVEAVVMVGKFYGFVHMAYEEDGWKAICELRGYMLHGKAMAVEASINSKKATPLYKQNIIGKGITTLDDFNDYSASKSKSAELRERRPPPEPFAAYNKQGGESSARPSNPPPPPNYYYHPAFPASASSSQPSPIGHTPPPMSRTSPRPDLASLNTMDPLHHGRESPLLKMPAVDANSNPIQEHTLNCERQETVPACCNLCGSVFDEWQHKPKILSCGHTYCCNCLICLAQDAEVKCPAGCPYTTPLTDTGISGEHHGKYM